MAEIKISELKPIGYELFNDSENYIEYLSEEELYSTTINGGIFPKVIMTIRSIGTIQSVASQNSVSVGTVNTVTINTINTINDALDFFT